MNSIMKILGSEEFWKSIGKSFLIALSSFLLTFATSVLIPSMESQGPVMAAVASLLGVVVNAIQKGARLK
jgi:hypothetical protein